MKKIAIITTICAGFALGFIQFQQYTHPVKEVASVAKAEHYKIGISYPGQ